jgi:hypothetical protein
MKRQGCNKQVRSLWETQSTMDECTKGVVSQIYSEINLLDSQCDDGTPGACGYTTITIVAICIQPNTNLP